MRALKRAADEAGSYSKLAIKVKVAANAPFMWLKRENVPAEHCPAIERETGVPCEELRPDVDWSVLRNRKRVRRIAAAKKAGV